MTRWLTTALWAGLPIGVVRIAPTSLEPSAKILAGVLNDVFDVRSELRVREAALVADLLSDRDQLAQLDNWVARWTAEASTKKRGPRALRAVPYAWLRHGARLASRDRAADNDQARGDSAFIAACTAGRAATRSWNASRFGNAERSSFTNADQRVTVKR